MKKTLNIIIHCLFPIILGGLIYTLFRSTSLRMFRWFSMFGLNQFIELLRNDISNYGLYIPDFFIYSLPDGLWIYSFTSALIIINDYSWNAYKYWIILPFFLGIGSELLQILKVVSGTFDVSDLLIYFTGILLSILLLNKNEKKLK